MREVFEGPASDKLSYCFYGPFTGIALFTRGLFQCSISVTDVRKVVFFCVCVFIFTLFLFFF